MARTKLSVVLLIACAVKCLAMTYNELEDFAEHIKKTSQLSPTLKKGVEPDHDYDEDEVVSDHAWEESGKFEGDLILNERQRRLIVENVAEGLARNGIRDGAKRWPNNEVIVYIQVEHFSSDQVQAITSGIEDIARASCVKFRPYKKGDRDAVVIQGNRRGCFSQVGYQGGYQVLNLSGRHPVGRGCFRHGTVVHELLHTLGFYHMQSSPDRDDYVKIIWENIVQPARHNFRKYNSFSVSDFGVGYDYDSVLHYSQRAFSANGQDTIVPKQGGVQIGQRVGLSDKDTQKLNKMYCDADSDNGQADEDTPSKKTGAKKKNPKNKPFEGQGIGYHQGKAVAIKLLPAPETYKLPDVPSFHVFDYFSKEPQILSTSEIEGFRIGKEIAYTYNPPEPMSNTRENNTPIHFERESELKSDHNEVNQEQNVNIAEVNHVNTQNEEVIDSKSAVDISTHDEHVSQPNTESEDPDLIEAFDRLSKIIKVHVYPSHTPDLSIYKMSGRYSDHYNPLPKEESDKLVIPASNEADKQEADKMNSAIRFINSMYEYSSEKSKVEKPIERKIENYEQKSKTVKDEHAKMLTAPPENESPLWHKHYDEEYVPLSHFGSRYREKKIENPNGNNDDWYQKYITYYPNDEYHDYSKDSSEGQEYDGDTNENMYISSIPKRKDDFSIFHVPGPVTKNRYKIEDVSRDDR